jgi:hypothetical protein
MKMMVRAHQCVQSGIGRFGTDLLYTVFSCSRYEGQANRCGLMFIDAQLQIELFSLPPMDPVPRAEALLQRFERAAPDQEMQLADSLALNVKLFDGAPARTKPAAVRAKQGLARKENLLQKFAAAPAGATRIAALTKVADGCVLQRAASADPQRLPPLIGERAHPADV